VLSTSIAGYNQQSQLSSKSGRYCMNIALLSSGLLALLLFLLSFLVSMTRSRAQRGFGHEADATAWLSKVVRAQGNAAEYIPALIVLMWILELEGSPNWADWVFVATCVVRYCHAAGMLLSADLNKANPLRFIGSLGTYLPM
jgi:uncharacterized membrane protein YecN with MAPEG domain